MRVKIVRGAALPCLAQRNWFLDLENPGEGLPLKIGVRDGLIKYVSDTYLILDDEEVHELVDWSLFQALLVFAEFEDPGAAFGWEAGGQVCFELVF